MKSEVKVGAFTLVGAVILAGTVSFMGALDFGQRDYQLFITYKDAQGLLKGAQVRYAGVVVGKICDIRVENNHALVVTSINEEMNFPVGAVFSIGSDGVMGEKFVSIMPPSKLNGSYIAHGSRLEGDAGGSMDDFLAQSTALLQKVGGIVENLDRMLTNEEIQKSLKEGAANLTAVTENLRGITNNLKGITGVINGVSQEPATSQALRDTIFNVRDTSAGAKKLMSALSDVEVDVDLSHNVSGDHWRSNLGFNLYPSKNDFVRVGVYDIGSLNKFDFIVGTKKGSASVSAGSMQGQFGVGLSYDAIKRFRLYSQLYDFDDAKLRLGAEYKINDKISIYGETMDARHGTKKETYAGIRGKF